MQQPNYTLDWKLTLSQDYLPPTFFFREEQYKKLIENSDWNYYCTGKKSTGKTMTVLQFKNYAQNKNHFFLYVLCEHALLQYCKIAIINAGIKMKWQELQYPMLYIFKKIEAPQMTIILDDVQKVIMLKQFNNFLHSLYENALIEHKKLRFVLVGTPSYLSLKKLLRDDVDSRLRLDGLDFHDYNAEELNTIFSQRLDLAKIEYASGAISWVSAKMLHLGTDIREGFGLLRESLQTIWNGGKQTAALTDDILKQVWEKHKMEFWITTIKGMNWDLQATLYSATKAAVENKRKALMPTEYPDVTTHEVRNIYENLCQKLNRDPLYPQRFREEIKELNDLNFLVSKGVESKGRGGRTSRYQFGVNPDTVLKAYQSMEGWE